MRRSMLCAFLLLGYPPASAADLRELLPALKHGGHVIVFRHGATDDAQKDVYPFNFEDMTAQRQLSEKGRAMARQIGSTTRELRIPIGMVYDSKLNRAIETARLLSGKDVVPVAALTDSGAGSAAAMAKPGGTTRRPAAPRATSSTPNRKPAPIRCSLPTRQISRMHSEKRQATCRNWKPSSGSRTRQVPQCSSPE